MRLPPGVLRSSEWLHVSNLDLPRSRIAISLTHVELCSSSLLRVACVFDHLCVLPSSLLIILKLSLIYRSSLVDQFAKSELSEIVVACCRIILFRILWLCWIASDPATSCSVGLRWHVFVEVIDPNLWSEWSISMEVSRNPPLIDQKYTYAFLCCSHLVGLLLALFHAVSWYVFLRRYKIYKS